MGEWWLPYGFINKHVDRGVILFTVLFSKKSILNSGLFSSLYIKISMTASTHSQDFLWLVNIGKKPKST